MTECQRCGAASTVFLCNRDITALADMLRGLPRFLHYLAESALGQARLGSPQRRHRGDEQPLSYNPAAARLYDEAHNTLVGLVRHLCEQRGIEAPRLRGNNTLCWWLADNVNALAADETAEETYAEIEDLIAKIERRINRPEPPRFIGPCIAQAPDEIMLERRAAGDRETRCNRALLARRDARTVTCTQCHKTYLVDEVVNQLLDESGHMLFTVRELVDWILPRLEEPVPQTTLERWIRDSWVPVRGIGPNGAQMVMLGDVRDVRRKRPRHAKLARA